jgi:hypothetical protein
MTLYRAGRQNFEAHKKVARWAWPLWIYVSVTGVTVYLLLYQIFPQKPPQSSAGGMPAQSVKAKVGLLAAPAACFSV